MSDQIKALEDEIAKWKARTFAALTLIPPDVMVGDLRTVEHELRAERDTLASRNAELEAEVGRLTARAAELELKVAGLVDQRNRAYGTCDMLNQELCARDLRIAQLEAE